MALLTLCCSLLLALHQPVRADPVVMAEESESVTELRANITALWAALDQLRLHVHHIHHVDDDERPHPSPEEEKEAEIEHSEKEDHVDVVEKELVDDVDSIKAVVTVPQPKSVQLQAICDMKSNNGLQSNRQHPNIRGKVVFNQPAGGPLSIQVNLKGIRTTNGRNSKHGFHVHEFIPSQEGYCNQAGSHYNPTGADHGGSSASIRHVGDFGNVEAVGNRGINIVLVDYIASLDGPHSILNRTLVVG